MSSCAATCCAGVVVLWADAARRFGKQMFLSVDVPPSFLAVGGGGGGQLVLAVERAVVEGVSGLESETR